MAYEPGAIDSALAEAVGDDARLIAELRSAFLDGAARALAAMAEADGEAAWRSAAARLRSLAASFGATRLTIAASAAHDGPPCDPLALRRLMRMIERL